MNTDVIFNILQNQNFATNRYQASKEIVIRRLKRRYSSKLPIKLQERLIAHHMIQAAVDDFSNDDYSSAILQLVPFIAKMDIWDLTTDDHFKNVTETNKLKVAERKILL